MVVKERYLGLHMPGDEGVPHDYINKLATLVEAAVDMDALMATAASATPPEAPGQAAVQRQLAPADGAPIIAVAQDAAFGFYYRECASLPSFATAIAPIKAMSKAFTWRSKFLRASPGMSLV